MIQASQARSVGRQMIRENKKLLIGSYFAYFGITMGLSFVVTLLTKSTGLSMLLSIGIVFISVPLMLGVLHVYNMVYYKRACSIGNMFDFFPNYHVSIKVVGVSYVYTAIMMAVMIPLFIVIMVPMIGSLFFSSYSSNNAILENTALSTFFVTIIMLAVAAIVISVLFSSMIMSSYYIALRNRSIAFGKLMSDSLKIGWKYIIKYFVFQLSFLGWSLLCIVPSVLMTVIALMTAQQIPIGLIYGLPLSDPADVMLVGLILLGLLGTLVLSAFLGIYLQASSASFWNTAIDEYEQKHPEYAGFVPHIPQPPAAGFGHTPTDLGPPFSSFPAQHGDHSAPSPDDTPPEHVEAEQVFPSGTAAEIFDVVLIDAGVASITVGRIISEVTPFGLAEAQALIGSAPVTIREGLSREEAHEIAKLLTDAGAKVEIR